MVLRGINYDIGYLFRNEISRPDFDMTVVKKEMEIIKEELNCNSVRVVGYDINRLVQASEIALKLGLQVWFSPLHVDVTHEEAINYMINCAEEAEKLRIKYNEIIFVAGDDYTINLKGLMKGSTIYDRIENIYNPVKIISDMLGLNRKLYNRLNLFLKDVTMNVKEHFKGKISYASAIWEKVNWSLFDIIGINHYINELSGTSYVKKLRSYYKYNKPIVVTEFGSCAYKGAEKKGRAGWSITEYMDGQQVIKEGYVRNESVQADYFTEKLDILSKEKVFGAFVYTFISPVYKHSSNPKFDLDTASFGIVKPVDKSNEKSYKGLPWLPKEAFHRLAGYYNKLNKY